MEEEVKPVKGPSQAAPGEHDEFLPDVGRTVGRQPDGEAGDDEQIPAEAVNKSVHKTNDYRPFRRKGKPERGHGSGAVTGQAGLARATPSSIILAEERRKG